MKSFQPKALEQIKLSQKQIQVIRLIGEYKGRQDLYRLQAPEKLENLRQVAIIQSVESSNRIEGVTAPQKRLEALVRDNITPENRSEGEIAGYRDVLNTLHSSALDIPFTEGVVLQLHRDLMKYGTGVGGQWKSTNNSIEEHRPDGSHFVRFQPVEPSQTPDFIRQLHQQYRRHKSDDSLEPLILMPLYILDFLCIHPFLDGNGRMSRLLTVLMLHQYGYEVGRFISLERIIEHTKESYYDTLYQSSQGWHTASHDPMPWIEYWLGVLLASYREFENRMGELSTEHGTKTDIVLTAIARFIGAFSISELEAACPSVSRDWIKVLLDQLKKEGRLEVSGRGRSAHWQKVENGVAAS
jgi:Fic family protein